MRGHSNSNILFISMRAFRKRRPDPVESNLNANQLQVCFPGEKNVLILPRSVSQSRLLFILFVSLSMIWHVPVLTLSLTLLSIQHLG